MDRQKRLQISLFLLRFGVFIVFAFWTADKFINPGHSAKVWAFFYQAPGLEASMLTIIGAVQAGIVGLFVLGLFKRFSYGLVLIMHTISTFSSYMKYMAPFDNLLFLAAWPMLAACVTLYLLRDEDTFLTLRLQ